MAKQGSFMLNLSVLYRNTQKFYDRVLAKFDIGSGQLIFLTIINENKGITMQEVTRISEVDKGTTTKSINRLLEQGYIQTRTDENDRRIKRLYTTSKANEIMNEIYDYRNEYRKSLAQSIDFDAFEEVLDHVTDNSRNVFDREEIPEVKIGRFEKTSLSDDPGFVSSSIYFAGCNFKCPYCNKKNLVYIPEDFSMLDSNEVIQFLKKRNDMIDSVVLRGGEPLLQNELKPFIQQLKGYGYRIKVVTNGSYPEILKQLIKEKMVDYVTVDIKNCKEKYGDTVGLSEEELRLDAIEETIAFLAKSKIPHDYVTTVVKEFHTVDDLIAIKKWLGKNETYRLQPYIVNNNLIQEGLHPYTNEEMVIMQREVNHV